ncbi:MAG: class I SAM-dependent methyltransferase [Candidatus Woesearchaeota archaeon]|nr:class I SAM-dependent methyltransferase [Candidatus Woesearchaeota archaeon]
MNKKNVDEKLVLEINKTLHNYFSKIYIGTPLEFRDTAVKKWSGIANNFLSKDSLKILDFGSGTGFVPQAIMPHLHNSTLICMDISKDSLKISRSRLNKYKKLIKRKKIKLKFITNRPSIPIRIPLPSRSVDIVLVNFVLHHLYRPQDFLSEAHRILKNKGILIVGFEPNSRFLKNKTLRFLNIISLFIVSLIRPSFLLKSVSKMPVMHHPKEFIKKTFMKKQYAKYNKIEKSLNQYFLNKNLIKEPFSLDDFLSISNYQDFIDAEILVSRRLFISLTFETYAHLPILNDEIKNRKLRNIIEKINLSLKRRFPDDGYLFFAVLKKKL